MKIKQPIIGLLSLGLVLSGAMMSTAPAYAWDTDPTPSAMELNNAQVSRNAATEGMVLLENTGHALPIPASGNVALFGTGAYLTVYGGTGSGSVNNRYNINVRTGLENHGYTITTSDAYWDALKAAADTPSSVGCGSSGGGMFGGGANYACIERELTTTSVWPKAATDIAIYVVTRNSGEGSDRSSGAGDYLLNDKEIANLKLIAQNYKTVIVALNVGAVVDTTFYKTINAETPVPPANGQPLDALILMSQVGQETGTAFADVISGDVTPSGKLVDTWAGQYSYYPASATIAMADGVGNLEYYTEGIYVGYRYFDSFYKTIAADPKTAVNYEFGYGLSYTDFNIKTQLVTANEDQVTVVAKVTNVGSVEGKEVVQVYFSAPTTGLDKPYQELAAYAKTATLQPGEEQILTISFNTTEMSSYDEAKAAYVLEGGDYIIRVGNSSRNTKVAKIIEIPSTVITEQLYNEVKDQTVDNEYVSDPANFYTYSGEKAQIAFADRITVSGITTVNNASEYEQNVAVDSTSPYYAIDKDVISTTTALIDSSKASNWENTGAAYTPKQGEVIETVNVPANPTLFDVAKGTVTMKQFVASLSVEQLSYIVMGGLGMPTGQTISTLSAQGAAGYTTGRYENLGIAAMTLPDGPAGLRITASGTINGSAYYQYATRFPIGTAMAQTWNVTLIGAVGVALGQEMEHFGANLWLAPGMNIHRDPMNGRNFEYYSEDPLVSGWTAANYTRGVQATPGVGVTLKHYAGNNQETNRSGGNSVMNERAMREIYLKGFEIAVKGAQPMAIMSSYNRINGSCVAGDYDLLTDLLRGEWGFQGLVMTDWGGCGSNNVAYMYAGNDLVEPGGSPSAIQSAMYAVPPTIDAWGLPVFTRSGTRYTFSLGGMTLSATGTETISTIVDDASIPSMTMASTLSGIPGGSANFATAQAAYDALQTFLSGSALNATQKAAITVTVTNDGGVPGQVHAYRVDIKGNYNTAGMTMRLGDLQRSAMHILGVDKNAASFQELADIKGVTGINIQPYSEQFQLTEYVAAWLSAVHPISLDGGIELLQTAVDVYALFEAQQGRYTPASYAPLAAALDDARALIASGYVTAQQVTDTFAALKTAADGLVAAVDKSALWALIDIADGILEDPTGLLPSSITQLQDATTAAKLVANTASASESDVLAAAISIAQAIAKVQLQGDKSLLGPLVDLADGLDSSKYTPDSWAAVADALADAKAVLADPDASEAAVDEAYQALEDALSGLVLAANKGGLVTAIGVAEQIVANSDSYVAASISSLPSVLAAAKAVNDNPNATSAQVTSAQAALIAAIAKARLKPVSPSAEPVPLASPATFALAAEEPALVSETTIATVVATTPVKATLKSLKAAKPAISGTAKVGKTLKVKTGAWTSGTKFKYQWLANGKKIAKATKSSLKLTKALKGKKISVKVTGSKSGYTSVTKTSAAKKIK
ncbi:MAG: glycoside hydrolase family 3 C-terminal domain-containing protein [Propionibacteriaceae bacterium]|jgi:beta-glucosidase|nr:glycoside hydrolase family 3 C-terminal domain-containing protein [Propionibacteriaceae bacterium]